MVTCLSAAHNLKLIKWNQIYGNVFSNIGACHKWKLKSQIFHSLGWVSLITFAKPDHTKCIHLFSFYLFPSLWQSYVVQFWPIAEEVCITKALWSFSIYITWILWIFQNRCLWGRQTNLKEQARTSGYVISSERILSELTSCSLCFLPVMTTVLIRALTYGLPSLSLQHSGSACCGSCKNRAALRSTGSTDRSTDIGFWSPQAPGCGLRQSKPQGALEIISWLVFPTVAGLRPPASQSSAGAH